MSLRTLYIIIIYNCWMHAASHTWPIQASHHVCSRSSTLQADPIPLLN